MVCSSAMAQAGLVYRSTLGAGGHGALKARTLYDPLGRGFEIEVRADSHAMNIDSKEDQCIVGVRTCT